MPQGLILYFGPDPQPRFIILWLIHPTVSRLIAKYGGLIGPTLSHLIAEHGGLIDPTLSRLIAEYSGLINSTVPLDRRIW